MSLQNPEEMEPLQQPNPNERHELTHQNGQPMNNNNEIEVNIVTVHNSI